MNQLLDVLVPQKVDESTPVPFRFGTVSQASPLRVQLDGDTGPLPITPVALVQPVDGDRVMVAIVNRRITVIGVIGGEKGVARLSVPNDVYRNQSTVLGLGPNGSTEPSLRLERLRGSTLHGGSLYIPADTESNGSVALLTHKDGENASRLRLRHDGQVIVNTYPTVNRPLPFAMASGTVSADSLTNGASGTYAVSFPSGRFTQAPMVFVNTQGTAARRVYGASGISTSGFTLREMNVSGGNSGAQTLMWVAIQVEV